MPLSPPSWSRRRFLAATGTGLAGAPLWSWAATTTGSPRPLRIAFFTDVHARVEWGTPRGMAQAAEAINATRPDFIIGGGDFITDGFQSSAATVAPRWTAYLEMHRALTADVHPAIGNHDLVAAKPEDGTPPAADPRRPFCEHFGLDRTYRSLDAAGLHLVFLDPIHLADDKFKFHGFIDEPQMAWLEEDLAGVTPGTPVLLVCHMPLMSVFEQSRGGALAAARPNQVVTNSTELLARFAAHNLVAVLQGHLHVDEWIRYRGTTYITGGAVCGAWWRGSRSGTEEGFGLLTLHPNHVDWQYIDYGWTARRPVNE